jgi:predicted lipoprotein with Yx(FWY)xxD motif
MAIDAHHRPSRPLAGLLTLAVTLTALAVTLIAGPAGARKHVSVHIGTAQNAKLGKRVLVNAKGHTLYTLSAETHGKFICTDSGCLAVWKPVVLRQGAHAEGVAHLGAVKRPDGRRQATYKGRPLYAFTQDRKKGDANGEGFKDVGTWHAAVAPKRRHAASGGTGTTTQPPPSGGYGY